jgi:hypothetical protein
MDCVIVESNQRRSLTKILSVDAPFLPDGTPPVSNFQVFPAKKAKSACPVAAI